MPGPCGPFIRVPKFLSAPLRRVLLHRVENGCAPVRQLTAKILEMKLNHLSEADFAGIRKSLRKPIVKVDSAVHRIDSLLNQTQKDPSGLAATANQIAKALNSALEPLKDVKDGIQQLQAAGHEFDQQAQYVGPKQPGQEANPAAPAAPQADPLELAVKDVVANKGKLSSQQSLIRAYSIYKKNGGKLPMDQFTPALADKFRKDKPYKETSTQRRNLV